MQQSCQDHAPASPYFVYLFTEQVKYPNVLSQIMIYHNIRSGLMQKLTQSLYMAKAKGALKFATLDPPLKANYS